MSTIYLSLSLSLSQLHTHTHSLSLSLLPASLCLVMSSMPKLRLASFVSDASDTTTSDSGGTGGRDDTDAVRTLVSAFATQQRATPDMNSLERYLRETSSEKCFTILAETITSKHDASEEVQTDVIAYAMCCLGYACVCVCVCVCVLSCGKCRHSCHECSGKEEDDTHISRALIGIESSEIIPITM